MAETRTLTVMLDGEPAMLDGGPETVADLLAAADARYAGCGRIVTALRIDGAEEPAFRDPHVSARSLSTIARVEIASGTPAQLALECLAEAGQALHNLAAAAQDVAARLRAGQIRGGNQDLVAITEGIATVLTITGAASLGLGIDLGMLETPHGTLSSTAQRAARDLEAIIAGQVAADWPAVADNLDHHLVPALQAWGDICAGLQLDRDLTVS